MNAVLTLLPLGIIVYLLSIHQRLTTRIAMVDAVTTLDREFGLLTVVLLLEVSRRFVGQSLALIGGIVIAYGFAGPYTPTILAHSCLNFVGMIDLLFLIDDAIFGVPAKISARYVYLVVLFGAILLESGAGTSF